MTTEEKARAYDEAVSKAKKELQTCGSMDCDAARQIFRFFPQLIESEDERIRKGIVETIKQCPDTFLNPKNRDEMLSYLEKQKESEWNKKPCLTCQEYEKGFKQGHLEGCTAGYNKAMKEVEQKEQKGLDVTDYCQPIHPDIAKVLPDVINELTWGDGEKQKEQKPADLSEMMVHKEPYIAPVPTPMVADEQKPAEPAGKLSRRDYLYQLLIDQLITYSDYEYLIGQKPAEWSEEDKEAIKELLSILARREFLVSDDSVWLSRWLKDLSNRFNLQPKQEWSEEDEQMLLSIINAFRNGTVSTIGQEQWLKSLPERFNLQPKEEWSEEDGAYLNIIIEDLKELYKKRKAAPDSVLGKSQMDNIAWLKSLRPSWKPSEEQMEALERASTNKYLSAKQFDILVSLYEQIKKL